MIGTRARNASWCHPISDASGVPLTFCCGKGTAPVSGPAGGAVLPGAVSLRPFQPRGPSLSGGIPGPVRRHCGEWQYLISKSQKCQAAAGQRVPLSLPPRHFSFCALTAQRAPGWDSCPRASPGRPGPGRESAARRWPRWWPWGRSAGRTGGRYTAHPCPFHCPGGN